MPPKQKEALSNPVTDLVNFLGLNYSPPKGAIENIKQSFGVVPFIRSGISRIMSLGNVRR